MLILNQKMTLNPILAKKSKTVALKHFIMPIIRYIFKKIKRTDSEKSSKKLIFDPKIPHLPHFRLNKDFFKK